MSEEKLKFNPGDTAYYRDGREVFVCSVMAKSGEGNRAVVAYASDTGYSEEEVCLEYLVSEEELANIKNGVAIPSKLERTPTNFEKATMINRIAGKIPEKPTWQHAEQQLKVIRSEFNEIVKAIEERNMDKLRDAIADVCVTAYGMGSIIGFDVDDDYGKVINSLFTRFDETEEDARLTSEKYKQLGVLTYTQRTEVDGRVWFATKSTEDQVGNDGDDYPRDKFVKSHKFHQPILTIMPELYDAMAESVISPRLAAFFETVGTPGFPPEGDVKHPIHGAHTDMPE